MENRAHFLNKYYAKSFSSCTFFRGTPEMQNKLKISGVYTVALRITYQHFFQNNWII